MKKYILPAILTLSLIASLIFAYADEALISEDIPTPSTSDAEENCTLIYGNIYYYIENGSLYSFDSENGTTSLILQREDISRIESVDENNFKCFIKDRAGNEDSFIYKLNENFAPAKISQSKSGYSPRLTAPERDNPYYFANNVFCNAGFGMTSRNIGNCTCYAYGRAYEILGTQPRLSYGNAGDWYEYNKRYGYYPYGDEPWPGAIAVWSKRGGAGHVAVVESVDGDTAVTSESGWKSFYFKTRTRSVSDPNFSASSAYTFLGFIYIAGAPTLLPPSDIEIETFGGNTTVSWSESKGAASYVCRIVNAKEGFYDAAPPVRTTETSATFLLPEDGTYYAYITAENGDLSSELSEPYIFGTMSSVCIWNTSTIDSGTTVAWEASTYAGSYIVDIMSATEGTPKVVDSLEISGTYCTVSLPEGTYYAAITPKNSTGKGKMSPWYLFSTVNE